MFKKIAILSFILAALVAASILTPNLQLQVGQIPPATELSVKARDLKLACPGSLYKAGGASGTTLGNFAHVGEANFASQFNSTSGATLQSNDGIFTVSAPSENLEQGSWLLNASQYQNASGATLKGLAATNCQLPSNDLWLLGGDTTTGREALLILRNLESISCPSPLQRNR